MTHCHNLDALIHQSERILLLQGPIGNFFYEFSRWLTEKQKQVFKINFNAGDDYFYPQTPHNNVFLYTDELVHFSSYLSHFCQENQIDSLVCFGDTRPYHQIAKQVCQTLNLSFWVFEEGYFRPHYITFEKNGVNDYSTIPRNADYFFSLKDQLAKPTMPFPFAKGFCPMAKRAIQYYWAANWHRKRYPHYVHHRILKLNYYIKLWGISAVKRLYYFLSDYNFSHRVTKGELGEFFILPLQVYDDSQVRVHSDYPDIKTFLWEVLDSFRQNAPQHCRLIIKHHPMDRGFVDYGTVIRQYQKNYPELKQRLYYIHDVPMPILLRKGKGMVTLNSTSGLSALLHNMPVITLGRANYNFAGLTFQGKLDQFWTTKEKPNAELFEAYYLYHLNTTLINGSFYNQVKLG